MNSVYSFLLFAGWSFELNEKKNDDKKFFIRTEMMPKV